MAHMVGPVRSVFISCFQWHILHVFVWEMMTYINTSSQNMDHSTTNIVAINSLKTCNDIPYLVNDTLKRIFLFPNSLF